MPWDPFLMKKLLKSEICGSINSAHTHCSLGKVNICDYCSLNSGHIPPKMRENKKKKNEKNENVTSPKRKRSLSAIQTSAICKHVRGLRVELI